MHATHICYIALVLSKKLRTSNPAAECVYNTRCREGCCGSPPLTGNRDSPRSTAFSVSETQAGKTNSRTSSASTCSNETNTLCKPPQDKHADSAGKQRQDRNMALRPSMHLHLPAQCIHACDHMPVFPTVSLHRRCCYLPPTASVSTRAVSLAGTLR